MPSDHYYALKAIEDELKRTQRALKKSWSNQEENYSQLYKELAGVDLKQVSIIENRIHDNLEYRDILKDKIESLVKSKDYLIQFINKKEVSV